MIKIINNNSKLKNEEIYDIIIIDEIQDMNKIYFKLIYKYINDTNNHK